MSRNTIRRVEVATPIEDERLKKRIRDMFNVMMNDNVKAREMQNDGSYIYAERKENEEPLNSQEFFYAEAYKRIAEKNEKQKRMKNAREKKAASTKPSVSKSSTAKKKTSAKVASTAKRVPSAKNRPSSAKKAISSSKKKGS